MYEPGFMVLNYSEAPTLNISLEVISRILPVVELNEAAQKSPPQGNALRAWEPETVEGPAHLKP